MRNTLEGAKASSPGTGPRYEDGTYLRSKVDSGELFKELKPGMR